MNHNILDLMKKRTSFTALVTPIRRCNIQCDHCFISDEHKISSNIMSSEMLKKSIDVVLKAASSMPIKPSSVECQYMGGEIHLLDESYIRDNIGYCITRAAEILDESNETYCFNLGIISNLIGISKRHLDVYIELNNLVKSLMKKGTSRSTKDFEFLIGTSYEPDTGRFKGKRTYSRWKENILYLRNAGVFVDVEITLTKGVVAKGPEFFFEEFYLGLGAGLNFDYFSPLHGVAKNNKHLMPEYSDLENFMIELIEVEKKYASERFDVMTESPFTNLHSRWLGICSIDYDGRFVMDSEGAADQQETGLGVNIENTSIDDAVRMIVSKNMNRIIKEVNKSISPESICSSCENLNTCLGGYKHYEEIFTEKDKCQGLKKFMDKYREASIQFSEDMKNNKLRTFEVNDEYCPCEVKREELLNEKEL